jgi:hypothetical protein
MKFILLENPVSTPLALTRLGSYNFFIEINIWKGHSPE